MPQTALTPAIRDEIERLGRADIMVGIPSFKNAATIGYVVRAAQAGLVQYFPDLHPVVVNSDAGSPDGTGRVVVETEPPDYIEQILLVRPTNKLERVSLTYPEIDGVGGKGAALRTIFEIADALQVQALVVVDSDLRSIVPEWIELLAGPILKGGYDFVAPLYARYKYDGTITNTVTYPLTRALYGHRIRQPIGGDFGVSGDLVKHYLALDDWTPEISRFGIDIWMTTSALTAGFAVCQTRLGAKIHDPKDPGSDLGPMFRQVVGTILRLANRYPDALDGDQGQPRRAGLRLRADHRAAAARGEHAPPPVRVPGRVADARRHVGADARAGDARDRPGAGGRGRPARGRGTDPAGRRWRCRLDQGHDPRDGRRGRRVPFPGRRLGPGHLRHDHRRARSEAVARDAGRVARADLLRAGRELRHREPQRDDRAGRGARRAPGARVRAAEAVPRRALDRGAGRSGGRLMARPPLPARILIPVANPMTAEELIRLGAAMLDRRAGELSALGIVEVPEGMPLSEGATRARHARRLLQRVLDYAPDGTTIHPIVRIGRHAAEGIIEASAEQEADLIIFGWGGRAAGGHNGSGPTVFSPTIDEVVRDSPCDIAVVKQRGSKTIRRVLVPVRGGPHAELALRYADAIAIHHDATVIVLHLVPPGVTLAVRAQAERALAAFIKQHITGRSEAVLREAPNVRNAILREAEKADLVVMGASASPGGADGESYLFGALPEAIAARARPTVMVVKTRESIERTTFDQLAARAETLAAADRAAEEARAVPVRVERWFGESNFHHAEFADLRRLVTLKEKQKLTISLVLPTLNEEETIGPIVRRAMREMVGRVPLLDEVLVIDSASTDRTREIAEAEGARVVQHPDVLTRYGSFVGKGEALWKSVFETTGDIIVWADTDVKNWHHRMVYGTLGPLLHEPRLQYVKGYYQRPIVEGGVLKEGGGGRVTELVARPLINLFYPELSGMIQPLSGEYAGRRTLLEAIPFFTGYAVEIGHLIDAAERLGIEGLGQVDLERRIHRNQELEGLSRMSFVILQAVMKRIEERRKTRLFAEMGSTMKLPRSGKGRLSLEVIELADQERPPMIRIPEYLERHRPEGVVDLAVIGPVGAPATRRRRSPA